MYQLKVKQYRGNVNMLIFQTPIYKLKDTFTEEFLDSWCMVVQRTAQYALGVTGINYTENVYIQENGEGYPYAAAAYKAAKDAGIKNKAIKGEPSPYGNIGQVNVVRQAMTIRDYIAGNAPFQVKASRFQSINR